MNKNLLSKICLAVALLITVYNFIIVEKPVENVITGIILILIIAATVLTSQKSISK